jgi:hypothetical protein
MKKFLIYPKLLLVVLICLASAGLCLTGGSALAAEESDQLLENIVELIQKATAAAMQAKETGDLNLSKAALEQANTAAGLLLGVADSAQKEGNAELALVALNMAIQISSVISGVLVISGEAADDLLASTALDVAEQTSLLISNIATMAQETDNPPLAQAALSAATNSRAMIKQVTETARFVAQTSTDRASVEVAEQVATKSEAVLDLNTQATSTALAAGAIPEEGEGFEEPAAAPAPQEPPLQDTDAASAV